MATYVAGIDGTPQGRDALALALALADATGAEVVAAHSPPPVISLAPVPSAGRVAGQAEELLERETEGMQVASRIVLADTAPARGLQRLAEDLGAEMIVVGSCHRGTAGRVLLGDVSRQTADCAPVPVAVASRGWAAGPRRIRHIGVGADDTIESAAALDLAGAFATRLDGELHLLQVIEPLVPHALAYAYPAPIDWAKAKQDEAVAARERLAELAAHQGQPCHTRVEEGSAAELLTGLSRAVDLLFVGSRGWGPLHRLVLGSTAHALLHHSECPLIVVPRPAAS